MRLMREREDKTVMTQRDADRRLGERLHDEVEHAIISNPISQEFV